MNDPYADRSYRTRHQARDLTYFRVGAGQTDLHIGALSRQEDRALSAILAARSQVEAMITDRPLFGRSLTPLTPLGRETPLLGSMLAAGAAAGVGPMAAVAGAIAAYVGQALLPYSREVIVENGGDIFLAGHRERIVAVDAGPSPLSHQLGVKLRPGSGMGVCTSSGTVGHSLSLGRADAALIVAADTALADAAATRLGNLVRGVADIEPALAQALAIPGVLGALVIVGDKLGCQGQLELTALDAD